MTAAAWLQVVCNALYAQGEAVYAPWLVMADSRMGPEAKWGAVARPEAQAWLAAYLWASVSPAGSAASDGSAQPSPTGPLRSESIREVSRSYGPSVSGNLIVSATDQQYMRNEWGIQYLTLRNQNPYFKARIVR